MANDARAVVRAAPSLGNRAELNAAIIHERNAIRSLESLPHFSSHQGSFKVS